MPTFAKPLKAWCHFIFKLQIMSRPGLVLGGGYLKITLYEDYLMEASHSWRVKTSQRVRCEHRGFHRLLLGIRFDALLISHPADGSAASKAAWCNCAWILLHCAHHRTWRKRHKQKKMLFNQLICWLTPVKPVQPKAPPGDRIQSQLPEELTSAC